ncbi:hypothetical protein Dimus_024578 [Dionaea muscipula]
MGSSEIPSIQLRVFIHQHESVHGSSRDDDENAAEYLQDDTSVGVSRDEMDNDILVDDPKDDAHDEASRGTENEDEDVVVEDVDNGSGDDVNMEVKHPMMLLEKYLGVMWNKGWQLLNTTLGHVLQNSTSLFLVLLTKMLLLKFRLNQWVQMFMSTSNRL